MTCIQGSGSNVDICIITADKTEYIRPFDVANKKGERFVCKTQSHRNGKPHLLPSPLSLLPSPSPLSHCLPLGQVITATLEAPLVFWRLVYGNLKLPLRL